MFSPFHHASLGEVQREEWRVVSAHGAGGVGKIFKESVLEKVNPRLRSRRDDDNHRIGCRTENKP